jgi:uncharacterized RDD family membrane protein YckC
MEVVADEGTLTTEAGAWDTAPHPWRRYGARIVDLYLSGGLLLILAGSMVGLAGPDWLYNLVVQGGRLVQVLVLAPLSWILSAPIVAVLLAKFGTTPGKLLFGLRVVPTDGIAATLPRLMKRELYMLIWGVGLGIPLISFVTMITSFETVNKGEPARWDAATGLAVEARRVAGWQLVGVIVGTVVVLGLKLWGLVEQLGGLSAAA